MTKSTLDPVKTAVRPPLRVDESKMTTTYANAIRTAPTADEVVLDFGMSLPQSGREGSQAPVLAVGSRIVLNWANAKRLTIALLQVLQAYEQQNGEIALMVAGAPAQRPS